MKRHRAKSFKSELEDGVQTTYKAIKLKSLEKDGRCASIRICGEEEDDGEKAAEEVEEELTEEQYTKKTTKKSARNRVEQVSDGDTGDVAGRQEEEEEEGEDGVGEDGVHGRWRHYHSLCSRLPGRERQIQLLLSLLGEVSSLPI